MYGAIIDHWIQYSYDFYIHMESELAEFERQVTRYTVKNAVYRNTPGEQYFTVSMVTHIVTMETVKYCSLLLPWKQ